MVFSRKQAQVQAAELAATFAATLEDISQKMTAAEKIADAGERYLALETIEKETQEQLKEKLKKVSQQVAELGHKDINATAITGMALGSGALATIALMGTGPIVILPTLALSCLLGSAAGGISGVFAGAVLSVSRNYEEIFTESKESFHTAMNELLTKATTQKESIVKNELGGLAASSRLDELYKHPAVKEAFEKAVIRDTLAPRPAKIYKPIYPKKP